MDWIGLLERAFYTTHRRCDVVEHLRGSIVTQPGSWVLDFGGGTGRVSTALAATHPGRYVVADPDPASLAHVPAAPRVHPVRIPTVPALPLRDDQLEYVIAVDVLHHVADPMAALLECRRCLCPGGSLLVVEFDARTWLPHVFGWLVRRSGRSCRFWTPKQLADTLEGVGFQACPEPLDRLHHLVRATKSPQRQPCGAPRQRESGGPVLP